MHTNSTNFGTPPPQCPEKLDKYIEYPSIVILFSFLSLLSLIFCIIIAWKYNSMRVLTKKVKSPLISNKMWIMFYFIYSLNALVTAIRYTFNSTIDEYFLGGSLVLHSLTIASLSLALNYQRKYRSLMSNKHQTDGFSSRKSSSNFNNVPVIPSPYNSYMTFDSIHQQNSINQSPTSINGVPIPSNYNIDSSVVHGSSQQVGVYQPSHWDSIDEEYDFQNNQDNFDAALGFKENNSSSKSKKYKCFNNSLFGPSEITIFLLFLVYICATIVLFVDIKNNIVHYVYLSFYSLQQLPIIILLFLVLFDGVKFPFFKKTITNSSHGPTKLCRVFLFLAVILDVTNDLPLNIWSQILPSGCTFEIFSWVDLIHFLDIISLFFFFLFCLFEYKRNHEIEMWHQINKIEDTFHE